ncbi:MAG: hypothetical protein R6W79_11085 [Acidimicrobiia bacterium]
MKPTRSAKTTDTSLRSPASSTGLGAGAEEVAGVCASDTSPVPQVKQKRFVGSLAVPQDGHARDSAWPHWEQNAWPEGFSVPQFPHVTTGASHVDDGCSLFGHRRIGWSMQEGTMPSTVYRDAAFADGRSPQPDLGVSIVVTDGVITWMGPSDGEPDPGDASIVDACGTTIVLPW